MKKVRSGDPLVIPAETFNEFVDTALAFKRQQRGLAREPQREQQQTGIALVRNESGANRSRFDVLGIAGPILTPTDNAEAFKERVALRGVAPGAEHASRFVVLLEPLVVDAIGRACVDGVCPVRVQMIDEEHGFAEIEAGTVDTLRSAASGSAGLLWIQPVEERDDPAIAWTVARIGSPAGAASTETARFARIVDAIGSGPPYDYTAEEVTFNDYTDPFSVSVVAGSPYTGDHFWNVVELDSWECGRQPVPTDALVVFWPAQDGGGNALKLFCRNTNMGLYL